MSSIGSFFAKRGRSAVFVMAALLIAFGPMAGATGAVELTVLDDMVLWLKADAGITVEGGRVTAWADQSGLGHDATALDYGPLLRENASPSGELDLLDFFLGGSALSIADHPDLNPGTGGYTVFVAGSPWTDTGSRALLGKADGTSSNDPGYTMWANVSNIQSTNVRVTGGPVPDPDTDPEARKGSQSIARSGDVQVITMSMTGTAGGAQPGSVTGYRDGVGGWTNGGNGPTDNQYGLSVTSAEDLYIGGVGRYVTEEEEIWVSYPHRGTLGEVLIYNTELSAGDRAAVESYLVDRWSGAAPPVLHFNSHYKFDEPITPDPEDSLVVLDHNDGVHGSLGRHLEDDTLVQNPTRVAGGVSGNALLFTRDAETTGQEVHDFASGGVSAGYVPENGSPLTFSAWVNPDTISSATLSTATNSNRILGLYRAGTNWGTGIALSLGEGVANGEEYDGKLLGSFRKVEGGYTNLNGTETISTDDTSGPNSDGWHHVAFSYDGTDMTLYVDGVNAGSTPLNLTQGNADNNIRIGCNQQLPIGYSSRDDWFTAGFDGMIDDVQFYSEGLSAADIAWLVANPGQMLDTSALPGDLNGDGFVGGDDLDIVRSFWGQSVTPGDPLQGDPSGDGFVGGDDLDIVRGEWGQGTPPAPASVPEPGMGTLLLLGVAFLLIKSARK